MARMLASDMWRAVQIAGTVGLTGLLATSAAGPSATEVPDVRLFFEAANADDNKLMFDEGTTGWDGPRAAGVPRRHHHLGRVGGGAPETTVLSLDTGHERDYSEGAAYREYLATDRLMFGVSRTHARLKNKAEVLTLLLRPTAGAGGSHRRALALDAEFLKRHPVHQLAFGGHDLLVITSREGANRVYDAGTKRFVALRKDGRVEDADGGLWKVTEAALVREGSPADERPRVPARRAFWFAWFAQFPDTELVK